MVMCKGEYFCVDKLVYLEIGDIFSVVVLLIENGWLEVVLVLDVLILFWLFIKVELCYLLCELLVNVGVLVLVCKVDWLEVLCVFEDVYLVLLDILVYCFILMFLCDCFWLMFFGNFY